MIIYYFIKTYIDLIKILYVRSTKTLLLKTISIDKNFTIDIFEIGNKNNRKT